jgi:ribonuclease R
MLTKVLSGEKISDNPTTMEELAVHASEREAEAADAERSSIKMKQVEYMAKKVGMTRPGVISGITEWGLYIEDQESGAEGMVRLASLTDDTYEYVPKKFAAIGVKTKRVYRLGDAVQFSVTATDVRERIIDMVLVPTVEGS